MPTFFYQTEICFSNLYRGKIAKFRHRVIFLHILSPNSLNTLAEMAKYFLPLSENFFPILRECQKLPKMQKTGGKVANILRKIGIKKSRK